MLLKVCSSTKHYLATSSLRFYYDIRAPSALYYTWAGYECVNMCVYLCPCIILGLQKELIMLKTFIAMYYRSCVFVATKIEDVVHLTV